MGSPDSSTTAVALPAWTGRLNRFLSTTPEMSDTTTRGVRVGAHAFFLPDQSDPDERKFLFGYNIVIGNYGDVPVQLLRRHWVIIDGLGRREDVEGDGVVGQTPRLEPGEAFKYQSFCPLKTQWGTYRENPVF